MRFLSLIVYAMAELNSCNRASMACKAKNIYYLDLYRKSLLIVSYNICPPLPTGAGPCKYTSLVVKADSYFSLVSPQ